MERGNHMKSFTRFFLLFILNSILLILVGTAAAQDSEADTTVERLLIRHTDAWSLHKADAIDNVFTKDGIYEDVAAGVVMHGREEIKTLLRGTFAAVPDFKVNIIRWFSVKNMLACEWIMSGTQTGDFTEIPATGKSFSVRGASVALVENGKFKRWTDYYDMFSFLRQLGIKVMSDAARDTTAESEDVNGGVEASGSIAPSGSPQKKPERISAGKSCIVNLIQPYKVSGTLTGTVEFNYRILVKGPCGSPPGTFDEEWIAYGTFSGTVKGTAASGNMSYVASVKAGGKVDGQIMLGQGLEGKLQVYGNFSDGSLSYKGVLK
jgi:steroid delta-isomerase-like uncharacterized protein